jgi:hypothetical protein
MTPAFQGEFQFRRYSDTSTQGQQVVFAVVDREALAAFIGKEGKRFMAVLVEIGDDEQPVQPKERFRPGPLCKEAIDLAGNAKFQKWCGADNEANAADWIRNVCCIKSRRELDESEPASELFHQRVRMGFIRYTKQRTSGAIPAEIGA